MSVGRAEPGYGRGDGRAERGDDDGCERLLAPHNGAGHGDNCRIDKDADRGDEVVNTEAVGCCRYISTVFFLSLCRTGVYVPCMVESYTDCCHDDAKDDDDDVGDADQLGRVGRGVDVCLVDIICA